MYPELFKIGPFTVYSYGLMLAIGAITASIIFSKELKRIGLNSNLGNTITLIAIGFGLVGAKLLYLFENFDEFLNRPIGMAFSPAGLTWYGGFILATAMIIIYLKRKNKPVLSVLDAGAPSVALGYGIARIGCHLSGDGDYGIPTDLPWAAEYSKGTYPPSVAFKDFPEIVEKYGINGKVPDDILVHPAPIYEFILGVIIFLILWRYRKSSNISGNVFMLYLLLAGIARFCVEFIRVNPRLLFGLSEAQLVSLVLIGISIIGFYVLNHSKRMKKNLRI